MLNSVSFLNFCDLLNRFSASLPLAFGHGAMVRSACLILAIGKMQTAHAMATSLNLVQTSYTYGDMLLLMKAVELKQVSSLISFDALSLFIENRIKALNYLVTLLRKSKLLH